MTGLDERTAVLENRVDHIEEQISEINNIEKDIQSIAVKVDSIQEVKDDVKEIGNSLKELVVLSTRFQGLEKQVGEIQDSMHNMKGEVYACKNKLKEIDENQVREAEFKKEKMKSRYAFWGVLAAAAISFIASILVLILK